MYLVRTPMGLRGADERSEDFIRTIGHGEIVRAVFKGQRNLKFHCKYWALLQTVFANQEVYKSLEGLHFAVKIAAGWVDHVEVGTKVHLMPKSTSFAAMSQADFDVYYRDAINAIVSLLPQWNAEALERTVMEFA